MSQRLPEEEKAEQGLQREERVDYLPLTDQI